jgi:hypothetical protein
MLPRPHRAPRTKTRTQNANQPRPKPGLTCAFIGADDGIRTRDPNLGKVVLYQLSHVRVGPTVYKARSSEHRAAASLAAWT